MIDLDKEEFDLVKRAVNGYMMAQSRIIYSCDSDQEKISSAREERIKLVYLQRKIINNSEIIKKGSKKNV